MQGAAERARPGRQALRAADPGSARSTHDLKPPSTQKHAFPVDLFGGKPSDLLSGIRVSWAVGL